MKIQPPIAKPFFSIILPTYNVEKYIARCLDSCLNQSFTEFEIIVVDDCGSDQSIKIAEGYVRRDPRVKIVYSQLNKGTFLARRQGVHEAKGTYILFLDPDDCLKSGALIQLHEQAKTTLPDIIFFGVEVSPQPPATALKRNLPADCRVPEEILNTVFCNVSNSSWGTPGKMYARNVAISAYDHLSFIEHRLTFAEDVLYLFSAVANANSCLSVNSPLYHYFKNSESITETKDFYDISNLCQQIDLIKSHLVILSKNDKLMMKNGSSLLKSFVKVRNELTSNAELMKRYTTDPYTGRGLYFSSVLSSFRARTSLKDISRLGIYVLTFGKFKF